MNPRLAPHNTRPLRRARVLAALRERLEHADRMERIAERIVRDA